MKRERLAVVETGLSGYPASGAFHPGEDYPESPFRGEGCFGPPNAVYDGVRALLCQLGLDEKRFGSAGWNPLGELIKPGMRVLLKPNWVRDYHGSGGDTRALVTHSSIIRAVLDYVVIALEGNGEIIVGDAPMQAGDFSAILRLSGFDAVAEFYAQHSPVPVSVVDFRKVRSRKDARGHVMFREERDGDPRGYRVVKLDATSHHNIRQERFGRLRVTNYDPAAMARHHGPGRHEYLISASVLASDVVINLPKLKTHKKAGLSVCMKNFFGMVGHKEWLPHHTSGTPADGGDQFLHECLRKRWMGMIDERIDTAGGARARLALWWLRRGISASKRIRPFPDSFEQGSWYGNDTVWRTTADLDRIALYADRDGVLQSTPQRRLFHVIDGIVAGQGDGPVEPEASECGLLLAGHDMVLLDHLCGALMGLRTDRIPTLVNALSPAIGPPLTELSLEHGVVVRKDGQETRLSEVLAQRHLSFRAPRGWRGRLEAVAQAEGP